MQGNLLFGMQRYRESLAVLEKLADDYPTDFSLSLNCGWKMEIIALGVKDNNLLAKAENYFKQAVAINPYRADYASRIWQQTNARARSGR